MEKEEIKRIANEVIKNYIAKHGMAPFATAKENQNVAKEVLKKCHQKYQKDVLDKLIDND